MARRNLALDQCVDCGTDQSDMTCPVSDPLDELLDALADQGYEAHFNEIDAQMARKSWPSNGSSPLGWTMDASLAGVELSIGCKPDPLVRANP